MKVLSKLFKAISVVLFCVAGGYFILATTINTETESDMLGREVQKKSWITRLLSGEEYRKGTLDQWVDVLILGAGVGAGVGLWKLADKVNKK